ncbi:MAG: FAD-binding oxidoreductase, partial [Pseudomonadota bacterium]
MALSLLDANDKLGQHAPSWYAATANPLDEFASAKGNLKFDVTIIGGGFSGVSAALHLSELGYKVCVLEAHRIGWGASGRNGGQVGSGQRIGPDELESLVGKSLAKQAFDLGVEACDTVRDLIEKHEIDCSYKPGTIEANHRQKYDRELQEFVELLNEEYDYNSVSYLQPEELG